MAKIKNVRPFDRSIDAPAVITNLTSVPARVWLGAGRVAGVLWAGPTREGDHMLSYPLLKIEDPNGLTDADWTAISRLQRAYSMGGSISLSKTLDKLVTSDPDCAARVLEALSPDGACVVPEDDIPEFGPGGDIEVWIHELETLAGDRAASLAR
jgi:hypothetical protein